MLGWGMYYVDWGVMYQILGWVDMMYARDNQ